MKKYILPDTNRQTDTVILANGEFPSHPIALSLLNNCKYLVCCDGAINNLVKAGKRPDAIVGDCDSLSGENLVRFADIIHRIPEQETNDLTKAVHFCLQQGRTKLTILGATGKREDHTIANVSLLCEYMKDADVEMITDYGIFNAIDTPSSFESRAGQQVSLFCIDQCKLTSHNLVYPIKDQIFTNWWQATLNESEGEQFRIDTDGRVVVYRVFV
ncbi:thiamine pyrophosphokinase [Dysgonomonas sp. PFB1-18]|uniref:thiamine diphosphokinase n=1 Tax=unclassified Dysgonomonas TaxID=2630389 RepID=UPI00247532FD|nr:MULTISPECIES: thiamine diphosphokinase [unclassified Dysgonomonas]MDH6309781.1 thiamine pyrophosphokinase [Dysgonomonas sp. PF1-14]MDH6339211.1 thiamine pyrophosphokinase [Dysgonomonas sp. PF1-16]MDH6380710.1 thiamine pyrophosphokinase [Dysgonomonas sp. PFB1-18]MDH6398206.1 thiamine pyrophosphokinase [Dysgonomonas sp. PF1-23]